MKYIDVSDTRIVNNETNIDKLFPFHEAFSWKENLERLVNATSDIEPKITKLEFDNLSQTQILDSVERSKAFISSQNFIDLQHNLNDRVEKSKDAILIASHIENVNIRGRLIEAIITSDEAKRTALMKDLSTVEQMLPSYDTKNDLGDFKFEYENGTTHTDIKTKIIYMNSNPKAYNIDKFLATMADGKSIFFIYFIGIDQTGVLKTILCSVYHTPLIKATVTQPHWSGRGTRGTTQFIGKDINNMILTDIPFTNNIEDEVANKFLKDLIDK